VYAFSDSLTTSQAAASRGWQFDTELMNSAVAVIAVIAPTDVAISHTVLQ
jgi:hypothetical protein